MISDMNKKVLFITGSFPPEVGGIQNYIYNLCKYSKHTITVLAPEHANSKSFDRIQNFRIIRRKFVTRSFITSGVSLLRSVIKLVRDEDFDLIVCNHVLVATVGRIIRFFTKKPFVIITYGKDTLEYLNNRLLKRLVISNLKMALIIITCSEYTKREVTKLGIEPSKIFAVLPGVDSKFIPKAKDPNLLSKYNLFGKKILFTVGRLVERKGHDIVIEALPEIVQRIPDLKYLIVGDGEYRSTLNQLVKNLGLEKYVVFTGQVDDSMLLDYYNLGDIFVMPSRFIENSGSVEGFGIVYLEAAACGKVVVGGDSGGAPEAIGDSSTGVLVDPTDSLKIADTIIRLMLNESLADTLSENARKRAKDCFSHEVLSQYFDKVIVESCLK